MRMYEETATTAVADCELSLLAACGHGRAHDEEASGTTMASFARVRRAVYHHDWHDLAEWVVALGELANLEESDIEALVASN